ncbi:hypothetical protein [Ligilactobacillus salivarius]|uniref:hypothetical protein n=1 Tax=Ligilactobacillus salivarius TaxID=1624 RepID=UPI0013709667|nr:hypothetical protein [Ligilactobacillus salivarius]MYY53270.1 hypothetical protein [Ligilactobacillus salivarius]
MTVGNIISMLKEISDNRNKKYSVTNFGGVVNFKITFFDKIPNNVANKLIELNLPNEVIELLSYTNRLNLFEDEFKGMEMDKCFKCTFLKWLEMFIVANGNAFWEWNY